MVISILTSVSPEVEGGNSPLSSHRVYGMNDMKSSLQCHDNVGEAPLIPSHISQSPIQSDLS